jgi:drug/metabolite transporter (DMT)-like permease
VAVTLGAAVLGERLEATQLAGGALVMADAALLALRGRPD